MCIHFYLQGVPQVGRADLRVICGVERDRGYSDEGQDAGFRVSPQHYPRAILCLTVEYHLMGSWKSMVHCKKKEKSTILSE